MFIIQLAACLQPSNCQEMGPLGPHAYGVLGFQAERRVVVPCGDAFAAATAELPPRCGPAARLRGLLRPDECARVLAIARRQLSFNTTPDSVDGRPTFEAPVFDRQSGPLNLPLCRALEAALETRAAPFLRRPASCGRDDFREISGGKTMKNCYRHAW